MPSVISSPPPIDGIAALPSLRTLGTGAQQAAAGNDSRFASVIPTQTGNANKLITTNGTTASWTDTLAGALILNGGLTFGSSILMSNNAALSAVVGNRAKYTYTYGGVGVADNWTVIYKDAANNYVTKDLLAASGGSSTLAALYAAGASGADSTLLMNATAGPLILKDASSPLTQVLKLQTNGAVDFLT